MLADAARSGHSSGHRGQYFAFLQNKNLDLPAWCAYMSSTECLVQGRAPTVYIPASKQNAGPNIWSKSIKQVLF
jgi:hypothetical protein